MDKRTAIPPEQKPFELLRGYCCVRKRSLKSCCSTVTLLLISGKGVLADSAYRAHTDTGAALITAGLINRVNTVFKNN